MNRFKRTVSALALGFCLAGGATFAPSFIAPVAYAQDAETRLKSVLEMLGMPAGVVNWSSVEETGEGIVAHGLYLDVSKFNLGFTSVPLGDLTIADLQTDGTYVTHFKGRFAGISVNLAELMATGQKMGQSGAQGQGAMMGMGLAMMAGYIQGLGYQNLDIAIDVDSATDLSAETATTTGALDVKDAFTFDFGVNATGVSRAYLDWVKENGSKMWLDQSPEAQKAMQDALKDPNSPAAKVGYGRYAIGFTDAGLMGKLGPQLAMMRTKMLGNNPDGSPKTAMTDDDIKKAAAEMAGTSGISPDKLEPVVRAIYNFVMDPKAIHLAVNANPSITVGEMMSFSNMTGAADPAAPKTDWNSRLSFEASN